ncbi:hypothetical protein QJT78_50440, partial [Bradyrhizobium sp. Mp27]|nr:hypothetical protein [Bradyrhizobium sp. Mp27]
RLFFVIFAPDSQQESSPLSGRKSTQATVRICGASSIRDLATDLKKRILFTRLAGHLSVLAAEVERAITEGEEQRMTGAWRRPYTFPGCNLLEASQRSMRTVSSKRLLRLATYEGVRDWLLSQLERCHDPRPPARICSDDDQDGALRQTKSHSPSSRP